MSSHAAPPSLPDDFLANLAKDGGRRVMYGGDPYEDDVERDAPSALAPSNRNHAPEGSPHA